MGSVRGLGCGVSGFGGNWEVERGLGVYGLCFGLGFRFKGLGFRVSV